MQNYVHRINRLFAPFAVAILAGVAVFGSKTDALAADLKLAQEKDAVAIRDGDRSILHYRFVESPFKPYVDLLYTPAGVQVLRDSPKDHIHHHGLMYALTVDKVDFWGEFGKGYGKEKHRSLTNVDATSRDGVSRVGFTQELEWRSPADRTMLVERRTIRAIAAADLGATLIDWRCRLQTPQGKESMTITGHHYFGLGMRFLVSMDKGGRFFNADDKPGVVVRGTERLTPTKWCAYAAKADGRPVTVALFDHPNNLRHPNKLFTMTKPFAYLSATLNEWKDPVVVKADKPLELTYGVALWDGEADKASVEKLYQRWVKLSNK